MCFNCYHTDTWEGQWRRSERPVRHARTGHCSGSARRPVGPCAHWCGSEVGARLGWKSERKEKKMIRVGQYGMRVYGGV